MKSDKSDKQNKKDKKNTQTKKKHPKAMLTGGEFIERALKVYKKGKYDYSEIDYKGMRVHIKIKCVECDNFFEQPPSSHLQGKNGCKECNGKILTTKSFIARAKKIHGEDYDYSKVKYKRSIIEVEIICKECGITFEQTPNCHLNGHGCQECGGSRKLTQEEFLSKARKIHGDDYDYSNAKYVNAKTRVPIKCNECDYLFNQTPNDHLAGKGCKKCTGTLQLTQEQFIQRAKKMHPNMYDYSNVEYVNTTTKVIIGCKKCKQDFKQRPNNHIHQGNGCPECINKTELKFFEWFKSKFNYKIKRHYKPKWCRNKENGRIFEFDFVIKKLKLIIEIDGRQHFEDTLNWETKEFNQKRDKYKMKKALKKGYSVIRIFQEDVYYDKYKWKKDISKYIKLYEEPTCFFLSKDEDKYIDYKPKRFKKSKSKKSKRKSNK